MRKTRRILGVPILSVVEDDEPAPIEDDEPAPLQGNATTTAQHFGFVRDDLPDFHRVQEDE